MDGEHGLDAEKCGVAIEISLKIDGQQTRLPIMRVEDIRLKQMACYPDRRLAQGPEPYLIISKIPLFVAIQAPAIV